MAPPGAPPGTLVYNREKRTAGVSIRVMDFSPDECHVRTPDSIEDTFPLRDSQTVSWIDIEGLHDTEMLARFGEHFGLHPLVLEDILNTHQRPRIEEYDDYFFIVARMLMAGKNGEPFHSEQVSFVLGKGFVATFQDIPGDVFDPCASASPGAGQVAPAGRRLPALLASRRAGGQLLCRAANDRGAHRDRRGEDHLEADGARSR